MRISIFQITVILLVSFFIVVFFLALNLDTKYTTEKLVGKKVDNFEIKYLSKEKFFNQDDLINNEYHLINIWASWCLPCKKEHPILSKTVEYIIANIDSGLYKNDIEKLTGPKVYARSIEEIYKLAENKSLEWSKINKDSNIKFEFTINNQKHQARIFGIDYSNNVQFKQNRKRTCKIRS